MALVFSSLSSPTDKRVTVDIIFVPAIGADPQNTWTRQAGDERLDFALRDALQPSAQTHLYDHLTPEERQSEVKAPQGTNDEEHRKQVRAFAAAENAIAQFGIAEWADRLLRVVHEYRKVHRTEQRPILVICHSTGGTVVKQAFSKRAEERGGITDICLGVIFFATPHHGSSVLSQPAYVQAVQRSVGLKWEMSEHLRHEFALDNPDLETLNYTFAKSIIGAKIHNLVETLDTNLAVLSSSDSGGESITTVRLCITDARSGKLGTPEVPIEDEDTVQLNTTHIGAPRFTDEDGLYNVFIEEIRKLVTSYSDEHRTSYQALNKSIMSGVMVDVHQFYGEKKAIKILSAQPCLADFLEKGPDQCMVERIRSYGQQEEHTVNGKLGPIFQIRPASETSTPTLTVTTAVEDDSSESRAGSTSSLSPPLPQPENIPTRRPSLKPQPSEPASHARRPSLTSKTSLSELHSPGHLAPSTKNTKQVQFSIAPQNATAKVPSPKRTPVFQLPSRETDRFRWIHVPFNHSHWVSQVLTSISQEKDDPKLHSNLLLDKVWFLQHNRSRHASPHARFVRPAVKCLLPQPVDDRLMDGITTPSSAGDDIQFALYLPYLHWDSFGAMQKRASVINRRRLQADARPVAEDVARSKSLEHKVLWQYLKSDRPVHCRRTLDQYGYPSLRNTAVRDADQILYKRTKPGADVQSKETPKHSKLHGARSHLNLQLNHGADDGAAKVLMVDQLWLWIIDNETIITFFTPKEREDNDNGLSREADIRGQIYQDINGDYANQCLDPWDFGALAVSHAIKALLDNAADQKLQVFNIFEEYISILTERQTSSFKEFRDSQRVEKINDIQSQSHVDNHKDLDALLELRDIEDELKTIEKLIKEQTVCVEEMEKRYSEVNRKYEKGRNGINFLHDVSSFLTEHKEQVENMLASARAAQQAFKDLLDMKQKQANIIEAQLARKQTEVAADQSRSIMVFTIFTIIFLPLSFFASVFGINAQEWNGTGTGFLPLHQIFTYMGSISLAVIVIALLIAFNKYTRRLARMVWRQALLPALNVWRVNRGKTPLVERRAAQLGYHPLDLEKANMVDADRAANRLSSISRRETKMNWEEDLNARQRNGYAY